MQLFAASGEFLASESVSFVEKALRGLGDNQPTSSP